jgi:ABC-type nitrate/sulfonate/bicarbonate transport system substrate-binding protein
MKVRVALPDLISPSYFPAIAAVELGLFRQQGIDAEIELIFPVAKSYEALATGDVDFVAGAAHAAQYVFPRWRGCQLLCALSQNMYWFLVLRSDLKPVRGDLQQLEGLRIAAAPGPVDGLKRMLAEQGVPLSKVDLVPVPATDPTISFGVSAAAALAAGSVDGFWANGMAARIALDQGVGTVVVDARRGDGPAGASDYTFPGLVATETRIAGDPGLMGTAIGAITAAHDLLRKDPMIAREAAANHFPALERELIAGLVGKDLPYYDPAISRPTIDALNEFSSDIGLLTGTAVPYEEVVATQFTPSWNP